MATQKVYRAVCVGWWGTGVLLEGLAVGMDELLLHLLAVHRHHLPPEHRVAHLHSASRRPSAVARVGSKRGRSHTHSIGWAASSQLAGARATTAPVLRVVLPRPSSVA